MYPAQGVKSQVYDRHPSEVRDTNHYTLEYAQSFVEKWDELIDWERRAATEGDFFIELLHQRGARRVLDAATGTGFHSLRLLEAGFEVDSVDGCDQMLAKAFENGKRRGHILRTVQADWRWLTRNVTGKFDAVICLGNSFTHLFTERDRHKTLAEFYAILHYDGVLILDQRNYDALLDHGLSREHRYYYCGENVSVEPEHLDEGLAWFRYQFSDNSVFYLNMYPLRRHYTRQLLFEAGFPRIKTYGDFQETYRAEEPDFLIHVADKQP